MRIGDYPQICKFLKNCGELKLVGKDKWWAEDEFGFVWENAPSTQTVLDALKEFELFLGDWFKWKDEFSRHQISVCEFIKSGKFGPVELGMNIDEVEAQFGRPESFSITDATARNLGYREMELGIWYFDEVFELHFWNRSLSLIWCDRFPVIGDSRAYKLEPWFLGEGDKTLGYITKELKSSGIGFESEIEESIETIFYEFDSGVKIAFEISGIENKEDYSNQRLAFIEKSNLATQEQMLAYRKERRKPWVTFEDS